MIDTRHCAICGTDTTAADAEFVLDEPIVWHGAFVGDAPPTAAGTYRLCRECAVWRPDARTQQPPARVRAGLDASAAGLHPMTAQALRAELLGVGRHLAALLQPVGEHDQQ